MEREGRQMWSLEIFLMKKRPRLNAKKKKLRLFSLKRAIKLPISFLHQAPNQISILFVEPISAAALQTDVNACAWVWGGISAELLRVKLQCLWFLSWTHSD